MHATAESLFFDFSARKLEQLAARIATCLDKLSGDQVWHRTRTTKTPSATRLLVELRPWIGTGAGKADIAFGTAIFARGDHTADEKERLRASWKTPRRSRTLPAARLTKPSLCRAASGCEAIYHVVEHFAQRRADVFAASTSPAMGF